MTEALEARSREGSTVPEARPWRPEIPERVAAVWLLPVAVLLAIAFVIPLIRVVSLSLTSPELGFQRYESFFTDTSQVKALFTTLSISAVVTACALAAGAIVAWTLRTTRSRSLKILLWLCSVFPLWMSVVVLTYVFTVFLQRRGIVNETIQAIGIADSPLDLLHTQGAVAVAMIYSLLPFAILPLYGVFVNIDEDLVRAAESLGASRARALASVVVPLALPSVMAAGGIVFVIALGFYITPTLLGTPTQPFLATSIADQVSVQFDVAGAAAASTILLVIALAIIAAVVAAVGGDRLRRTLA